MKPYKNILLATDFSATSRPTVDRAVEIAAKFDAKLSILHVAEYATMFDPAAVAIDPFNIGGPDQILYDAAISNLMELGDELGIPDDRLYFENGPAKEVIVRIAAQLDFDLVVIGTLGREGLGALLGTTASSVIVHAPCDVLTVRLHPA